MLSKKYSVEIFDKARGPGGRASNRRYKENLSFDHGLQYISPKSSLFKKFIKQIEKQKIIKKWPGNHLDLTFRIKKNLPKYIGIKGNNDICKYLIKNIKSNFLSTVTSIKFNLNHWVITLNGREKVYFKNLILTCPYPQLKKLGVKYLNKTILNLNPQMAPNVTVIAAYKGSKQVPVSSIKFNNRIISWAAHENTKKRFKSKENLWTIQCTEVYSKKIINLFKNNKKKYQISILKEFEELTGYQTKNIVFQNIHGWKYAYNNSNKKITSAWLVKNQLGICADWLCGSKGEDSWLSSNSLYKDIKKNPPTFK